jgi:hypothetical protein
MQESTPISNSQLKLWLRRMDQERKNGTPPREAYKIMVQTLKNHRRATGASENDTDEDVHAQVPEKDN